MNEGRDSEVDRYQLTREVEFINRFIRDISQPTILLDACCGSGSVSSSLQNPDLSVVGLDLNYLAISKYHQLSPGTSLIMGNVLLTPFADTSINCIVAIHCFDHLNRIRFFEECYRVLRNDGLFIFDALNRHSYKWVLKRLINIHDRSFSNPSKGKWLNIFSCREVLQVTSDCGFDVQDVYGYSWAPLSQNSNSQLIRPAAFLEQAFHLNRFFMISPRFLVAARKQIRRKGFPSAGAGA